MEDMESLLIPQISMDVDETPLNLEESLDNMDDLYGNPDSDNEEHIQIRLRNLMELENFDPAQTPEKLTSAEIEAKERLFSEGHPPIEYVRMHCSSCNCHLGTAPLNQDNRYIHPMLNVLVCKNCYEFYCSGDFEKDEDGSELYCRWCGQGGKVMCCSGCAYVFCQRCVRQNLGKRTLDLIIESDDWYCFACNPSQLINLRILCATLFDYVKQEIREVKQSGEIDRLKRDFSMCCNNKSTAQKYAMTPMRRRRRAPSEDQTYHPSRDKDLIESRKATMLKKALNNVTGLNKPLPPLQKGGGGLNVVQSPPPLVGIGPNAANIRFQSMPRTIIGNTVSMRGFPIIQPRPSLHLLTNNNNTTTSGTGLRPQLSGKPLQLLCTTNARPLTTSIVSNMAASLTNQLSNVNRGTQNFIPLTHNMGGAVIRVNAPPNSQPGQAGNRRVTSLPTHFPPGIRNNWFNQAATITSTIVARLSTSLVDLSNEQSNATSVEQLATVHNKLQELLSSSVNSMIQVRKNLRNEFLNDLNKMRFTAVPKQQQNLSMGGGRKPGPLLGRLNMAANEQPVVVDDDDDVIIVNNEEEEDPLAIPTQPVVAPSVAAVTIVAPSVVVDDNDDDGQTDLTSVANTTNNNNKGAVKIKVKTDLFKAGSSENGDESKTISNGVDSPLEMHEDAPKPDEVIETDVLANVDKETYLQIQHALAESKLEALIEENSKYKVDTAEICPEELAKILTVRVVLTTDYSPMNAVWKRRRLSIKEELVSPAAAKVRSVDFEEILHGNLINTEKPHFDKAFSSFVEQTTAITGDGKDDEEEEVEEEEEQMGNGTDNEDVEEDPLGSSNVTHKKDSDHVEEEQKEEEEEQKQVEGEEEQKQVEGEEEQSDSNNKVCDATVLDSSDDKMQTDEIDVR